MDVYKTISQGGSPFVDVMIPAALTGMGVAFFVHSLNFFYRACHEDTNQHRIAHLMIGGQSVIFSAIFSSAAYLSWHTPISQIREMVALKQDHSEGVQKVQIQRELALI